MLVQTYSVEQHEVPVVGQVEPSKLVGLVAESKNSLDGNVHDHHTLGTKLEGKDFESIGDEQSRESHVVKGAEEPDKHKLRVARTRVCAVRVLVNSTTDGPAYEREAHATGRDQE